MKGHFGFASAASSSEKLRKVISFSYSQTSLFSVFAAARGFLSESVVALTTAHMPKRFRTARSQAVACSRVLLQRLVSSLNDFGHLASSFAMRSRRRAFTSNLRELSWMKRNISRISFWISELRTSMIISSFIATRYNEFLNIHT